MVIKMTNSPIKKYNPISGYSKDVDRIRMYAALNKIQVCDFIELLVNDWVEKHPEFKNLPMMKEA